MSEDYNKTLNLPQTEFPMRANLPQMEKERLNKWNDENIYEKLIEKNSSKPLYILHDGPPYANGDIHLGTALNKILKDFVIRYKNMTGFKSPYVPGWDTHGLPTELKARKKTGVDNSTTISDIELRKICKEFALKYLDDQRNQFIRLGVLGRWHDPYITLKKEYEAMQIKVFAQMARNGYIYKGLKPVYWCTDCKTALAEAEIEYSQDECTSIYVKFKVSDDKNIFKNVEGINDNIYFVIWTTTTWTLPGNVAISLGPNYTYCLIKCGNEFYIMAEELYKGVLEKSGKKDYSVVAKFKGKELEYIKTEHPFLNREPLVIVGDHVTLESGTGCVHTAPGHGLEDYDVCRNYEELPIVVPVDANGVLTEEAGENFAGLSINDANIQIENYLEKVGLLLSKEKITHQYPHCWRCKEPVLFRATEQWFCSIEDFKDKALEEIKKVKWVPSWGEGRITNMVRDRKDWCISRQRKWGVPIPIFFCSECSEPLIDYDIMMKVSEMFKEEGSDSWYAKDMKDILPNSIKCSKCGSSSFEKEKDIMDVWFDSGSSHASVLQQDDDLRYPADLYLEGADQYRGWFQSSLLTAVATKGSAPYKTVVTTGWTVDGDGRKMSKSLGNGIDPKDIIDKYGADILRLWVASSDYHSDIRISEDILKQLTESYRKIRNTARFILSNLYDYNPDVNRVNESDLMSIDKWALYKLNELISKTTNGYDSFEFYQVYHAIHNFCVVDMSNFYLDIIKDRLYVEKSDSIKRRSAQMVIYEILISLTKMICPILSFTADEIWQYTPKLKTDEVQNIILNDMPKTKKFNIDEKFINKWDLIFSLKSDVQKALEEARKEKIIGKSLQANVQLVCSDEIYNKINKIKDELKTVFIVSEVEIINGDSGNFNSSKIKGLSVNIKPATVEKCERCWIHSTTVGENKNHPTLCSRCAEIVE